MNHQARCHAEHDADTFGIRITARLTQSTEQLPHDITERLRVARVRALEKRQQIVLQDAAAVFRQPHTATLTAGHSGGHSPWWNRLGSAGLLLVLAAGLLVINAVQDELGARELADIDAALLTDDLPPAAYVDAGFAQFLKMSNRQEP